MGKLLCCGLIFLLNACSLPVETTQTGFNSYQLRTMAECDLAARKQLNDAGFKVCRRGYNVIKEQTNRPGIYPDGKLKPSEKVFSREKFYSKSVNLEEPPLQMIYDIECR